MSYFDPSANSAATPAEAHEGMRRVGVMMTSGRHPAKSVVEMLVAQEIWRDLDAYRRQEPPAKPDEFPLDEQKIVDRMRFVKVLAHPKQDDLDLAMAFGNWRCAVLTVESRNAGRLEMLLEAIRVHERIFTETGDEGETVRALRSFAENEYSVKLPEELPEFWQARPFCARAVQEDTILPGWLRRLEDRPRLPSAAKDFTPAAFSAGDYSDDD